MRTQRVAKSLDLFFCQKLWDKDLFLAASRGRLDSNEVVSTNVKCFFDGEGRGQHLSVPPALPPSPLSASSFAQSVRGDSKHQSSCRRRGRGRPLRLQSARCLSPLFKMFQSCVPACTSPCQHRAGGSLWRMGPRRGADGRALGVWDGRRGEGMQSDTGGWLRCGLLFAVSQSTRLLLVSHTHLLRHVDERAGHGQAYTDTEGLV